MARKQTTQVDDTNVSFENLMEFVQQNIEDHPQQTVEKVLELYGPHLKNPYETRRYQATTAALIMASYLVKRVVSLEEKLSSVSAPKRKKAKRLGDRLKTFSKRTTTVVAD